MIKYVEQTGSTNADLAAALRAGERVIEGDWLVAKRQDAGKGRQGRTWYDGAGNFMGSTVVHMGNHVHKAALLNYPLTLALFAAVSEFLPTQEELLLKWPNDVLLRGSKLSGILMELVGTTAVIGIGVNLAKAPVVPDRTTIALTDVVAPPARTTFAETLASHFADELRRWRDFGDEPMRNRWLDVAHKPGSKLAVHDTDGTRIEGRFDGLEVNGALRLRLADGQTRVIHTGDVTIA